MNSLTVLNPLFVSLLPFAAAPVLFHLFFRRRKQTRPVPSLMFFHWIDPKLSARRRVREWLILLLRALLIALMLLALARPRWLGVGREGALAVALVLDNSGSMSGTGDGGQPKLKEALSAAHGLLASLRRQDSAGIVLLVDDPTAPMPAGLSEDKAALKSALDRVTETEAGGSVARAMERAVALLEGGHAARTEIHVFSDLHEPKWGQASLGLKPPPRGTSILVHRLGTPPVTKPNVSLTSLQVPAHGLLAGRRFAVAVGLANPTRFEAQVRLNWTDDTGAKGSQDVRVPGEGDQRPTLVVEGQNAGFHWLNVWVEGDDFPADNRAAAAFFCGEKRPVALVGERAELGQLPLALAPGGGRISGLTPELVDPEALRGWLTDKRAGLVAVTWQQLGRAGAGGGSSLAGLRKFIEEGGACLLVPTAKAATVAPPRVAWLPVGIGALQTIEKGAGMSVLNPSHGLFNDLRDAKNEVALRNIKVFKFAPLELPAGATPLLGLEDGRPILAEAKLGRGVIFASGLAFDSSWSNLPLKPAFLALAQSLALRETGATPNTSSLIAGEPLVAARGNAASWHVQSLAGSPLDWKGRPQALSTLPRAGVYALRSGDATNYVVVRSAEREGRQRFVASDRLPALGDLAYAVRGVGSSASLAAEYQRLGKSLDLSTPLLVLALLAWMAESWLANQPPRNAKPHRPALPAMQAAGANR